ncbi:serine/arginine repetitive matrix protein 1-like [Phasianus colchicus]|uniref:serine/arginine repetitive matrix protein 1-like n=1 Tax=Phasianus colchicus TaxID=9054 RepID=UPI00129DB969|nr:serine/arginine repetitive matrix protein 1-like [Phasianus colchicus]
MAAHGRSAPRRRRATSRDTCRRRRPPARSRRRNVRVRPPAPPSAAASASAAAARLARPRAAPPAPPRPPRRGTLLAATPSVRAALTAPAPEALQTSSAAPAGRFRPFASARGRARPSLPAARRPRCSARPLAAAVAARGGRRRGGPARVPVAFCPRPFPRAYFKRQASCSARYARAGRRAFRGGLLSSAVRRSPRCHRQNRQRRGAAVAVRLGPNTFGCVTAPCCQAPARPRRARGTRIRALCFLFSSGKRGSFHCVLRVNPRTNEASGPRMRAAGP